MTDTINPQHYRSQPTECIWFTESLNFCLGNAFKYIWRYREKNGLEDLKKAEWYLLRQMREDLECAALLDEIWLGGSDKLHECRFTEDQREALLQIWAHAWQDTGDELPAALAALRRLMAQAETERALAQERQNAETAI